MSRPRRVKVTVVPDIDREVRVHDLPVGTFFRYEGVGDGVYQVETIEPRGDRLKPTVFIRHVQSGDRYQRTFHTAPVVPLRLVEARFERIRAGESLR